MRCYPDAQSACEIFVKIFCDFLADISVLFNFHEIFNYWTLNLARLLDQEKIHGTSQKPKGNTWSFKLSKGLLRNENSEIFREFFLPTRMIIKFSAHLHSRRGACGDGEHAVAGQVASHGLGRRVARQRKFAHKVALTLGKIFSEIFKKKKSYMVPNESCFSACLPSTTIWLPTTET